MAQSGLNSAKISQDFRILMTKVALWSVLISFPTGELFILCNSLKLMNTLETRNSSRESLPEDVRISQWVLTWLSGCDFSPRIFTSRACPSKPLLPYWAEREKAGRAHSILLFPEAPPSRLRELSLDVLRCVFTSQIFLNGLASIWPGDSMVAPGMRETRGVHLQGAMIQWRHSRQAVNRWWVVRVGK